MKNILVKNLVVVIISFFLFSNSSFAISIIQDSETEDFIKELAKPVIKAAGFAPDQIKFFIIDSKEVNAFTSGENKIFIYRGLIESLKTPEMIQAVIAHELGHVKYNHVALTGAEISEAKTKLFIPSIILGAAGALASGNSDSIMTGIIAGEHMATRQIMKYSRSNEFAADDAAINFLNKAKCKPSSLVELLQYFYHQHDALVTRQDEYDLTHPLSQDRVSKAQDQVKFVNNASLCLPADIKIRHELIKAKISSYLDDLSKVRVIKDENSASFIYSNAILDYRRGNINQARQKIERLIAQYPNNIYFKEFKAGLLLELGSKEALSIYTELFAKRPRDINLLSELIVAQLALNSGPDLLHKSLADLERLHKNNQDNIFAYYLKSQILQKTNQEARSLFEIAKYSYFIGNENVARTLLTQALKKAKANNKLQVEIQDFALIYEIKLPQ